MGYFINLLPEKWLPIQGYETYYQISDHGRVKSLRTKKILKPFINHKGYYSVDLRVDGKRKTMKTSRLVAVHFLGLQEGKEVNHINGDKFDNFLDNLEWVTHRENCIHKVRVLKKQIGSDSGMAKLNEVQVSEIKALLAADRMPKKRIAEMFDISIYTINDIKAGRTWRHV